MHPDSLVSSIWNNYDVDSINAGSDTTCAIMSNLESVCWGKSSQTVYIDPVSNIIISEGKYPALMYAQNKWSVAYYDSVNGDLGYAIYDGNVWNTSSIYSGSNDIGNGVSVGLDNNDRTSLVAYDYTNDSVVHFQKRTDSIESDAVTTTNNYFPTTVVDNDGIKHVVYIHYGSKDLRYTYFNGTEWSAPTTIVSGSNNVLQGWGVKDLEIDSIGELHLSYYTWDSGPSNDILHLNYAKYNGSAWNITEIKQHSNAGALDTWVSKLQTSLELDSNNHPHIAYYNGHNSTIGYSHYDGTSWVTTTVATDSNGYGGYASIALDSNDYPRIAYYNYTNNSLELATWSGSNWNFEVVFSGGGKYPSLEIDTNDYNRIVYYGNTANAVRYGISTDDGWTMEEVNAFGIQTEVTYPLKFGIDNNNNPRISLIDFVGLDNVVLIYNNGGEWYKFDVEDYSGKGSNFLDTFIDSEGTAHITYVDTGNTKLVRYSTIYTDTVYGKYDLADTGDVSESEPDTSFYHDASNNLNAIFMDNNESGLKHVVSHQLGDVDRTTPGYRGYYPSLEVDSTGRLHAAYWDTSSSDLVYSTKIDGGAWQTQIIDQEGSVGKFTSIALDSDDNPHISYIDETNQELKYAKFNGTGWEISEIYNDWMDITYGYPRETSIAIDSFDRPHIAYNVMAYNTSWSGWNYFVRHTFNNESGWETSDVKDQNRNHNYGNTGRDVSLAINSTGEIFIIYHDDWDDSLYVANMTMQNLPTDNWEIEKISTSAGGLERSAALTIDTNDSLHVAYYDRSGADLHYAYCSSMCDTNANWEITSDVDTSSNSIGRRVDIIVDFDNNPHIAHYDARQDDLEYAYCEDTCSSSSSWYKRTMESGDNVGYMPSLVQDKNENIHFIYANLTALKVEITTLYSGNNTIYNISSNGNHHYGLGSTVDDDYNDGVQVPQVHLSYYNGTDSTGKLQYSYFNDVGLWETTVIDDSSTKTGLYSDIELDGAGYPHISYYDYTNSKIKYAKYDGSAWIISVVASVGSSSSHTSIELDNLDRAIIAYRDSSTGNLEMASWDGTDWIIATQDDAGTGINDNSGVELIFHSDGRNYLAFYDGENDNLEFVEAGYYSPVLMGNSEYDRRGTLLGGGSNPVSTIDIGDTHGCAIIANVTKCWGLGSSGQLGNNVFDISSLSPVNVTTLAGFIPIEVAVSIKEPGSSGSGFSCSLYRNETTDARSIMCWGNSENGQIGSGLLLDNLGEPSTSKMVKTDELTILGIVDNSEYHSTSPNDVMKIFTNKYRVAAHNCAISYVGHVKCWGYNYYGQLGLGNTTQIGDGPNEMGENQKFVPLGTNRTAKDMALGDLHSCAILDNDSVKCWGSNNYGQLGLGNTTQIGDDVYEMWGDRHTTVDLGTNVTATQITAGAHHTCILTNFGEVKCWGSNSYGQLGLGNTTRIGDGANEMGDNLESVDLGDGRSAIEISAGQYNTCAILDSGLVKCWGYNNYGQLGIGSTNQIGDGPNEMGNNLKIADLGDNITALSIETSLYSVCAILNTRDIKCWGYNGNGQLGLQNTTYQGQYQNQMGDSLATLSFEDQMSVFKLSGGGLHNCAILENEELKCWGYNSYGQLGIGNTNQIGDEVNEMGNYLATTRLPTPYIKFISSGHSNTCAIIFDDSIRCWGYNGYGQLGIGNTDQIGDGPSEMGVFMEITDINLVPQDTDGDGWIDVWDDDDDGDGYIDINDDLPLDVRDHIDSDGDGLGDNVDTDDDDDSVKTIEQDTILTWSDIEEEACGYMPMSSLSTPADYDGDGICDKLDNDVDGNGWGNTYQRMCHDAGSSDSWEQSEFFNNYYYDGPYYAGYDFLINEYGIQLFATYTQNYLYSNMLRHDGTIVDGGADMYASSAYYYMDVEQQNGITYLLNQNALYRGANRNTSEYQSGYNFFSSTYSFDGSDGGELAISQDGQIALAYNGQDSSTLSSEITGSYLTNTGIHSSTAGTNFAFDAPFWARGGQIVFGSDYRLHLLQLYGEARDSGLPIGFYHSYADLNLTMDMDSIVEWSEPSLVLNRNQSANWYDHSSYSDAGNYRADLHISDDGTIYAAMYNNTDLVVATYDGTSWNNQVLAESTGINEGVVIASNSTHVPHIAWINHSSDTLMISVLEGAEWTTTEVWDPGINWDYNYRDSKLTLEFNEFDDIFLMSTKYGTNSAIMHHKSSLYAPEYNYNPTDYDLDGICDNLQYAVIDYGREDIEIQVGEMISFTPSFRGQEAVEIWTPSLPEGLSINNTTGIISGTPIFTNLAGTSYTIYSNSTNTSYPITLTISITSKPSTFAMYGDYYGYTGGSPISEMQNAYDSEGNLYYYGACVNFGQWSQDTNWSGSCNGAYDLVIAKRNSNSTWAWVKLLDCSSICSGGSMVLDDAGNSYVIGDKSGNIDLPGSEWDLTSRHSAFVMSLDSSGEIRWVEEIYSSVNGVTWKLGLENSETIYGYGMSQISVNNSTGELTFSGSLKFNGNAHDLTFGDLTYTSDVVDSNGPYRPFVARMNESGNFSWVQMAISTGDSWIQDMVVQENGTVRLLWKSIGEISLGEYTIGQTEGCYSSVGSCSRSILGSINSTGNWTGGVPITVYSGSSNLFNEDVVLMMEQISDGDLIISIWARSDVSEIRISNTTSWFNTTCQDDNLVLIKLDKDDFTNKADRDMCTPDNSMYYANRYSRMKVDSQDRLWLFLGQQYYSTSNYFGIFRMDDNFNTDFRENLTYYNNPSSSFAFSWKSVCFDSNDNVLASAYSSTSSLYYDGAYMSYTGSYYYRVMFFMDEIKHTIDGQMPVSGEEIDYRIMGLGAISQYDYNFIDSFSISPDLPEGLIFSTTTGSITGTAINNASQTNYTIWANDTGSSIGNVVLNISFGIGNGKPTVTYDQTEYIFERGTPISPIVPTEINGSIISWQVVPELPNGLELGDSNGTIWGTPISNMSASMFTLQVSSDGATRNIVFTFTINEPLATIEYGNGTVTIGRDTVVNVQPTLGGGVVSSFGISPITLPLGLSFNTESGSITGTPRLTTSGVNYTVWANNTGGSVSTTITLIVSGTGISLTFPTPSLQLVNGSEMQPFAGQTSGSAPESWEILPELPDGLEFGENNGTIWGAPEDIMNGTMYRIWANTTGGESASAQLNISILLDTDGDEVPDITDNDDDNDGWLDADEISCENDPLNINDVPSDADNDGICDSLDDSDDSIIVISYITNNLNITVNLSFTSLVPLTSGGAITSWEVSPELPSDIFLNPSNGVISGMAITIFNASLYTIWGNNSVYSDSFDITITSSLLDTDGDGIPDEIDEDDDDDGWLDTEEETCLTDLLDEIDVPSDSDGDGLCDGQDSINDSQVYLSYGVEQVIYIVNHTTIDALQPMVFGGDVVTWEIYPELPDNLIFHNSTGAITGMATSLFESLNITIWANNSLHSSQYVIEILSILLDTDEDGIPDEIDDDDDNDGWMDADEISCLTDTTDETDYPIDNDGDSVCDGIDDVNDSPIYLTYSNIAQNLFVNEPMDILVATVYGGDVREWEIYPDLPEGLYFDQGIAYRSLNSVGTGTISGAPINAFNLTTFTVWANNSLHSDSVVITLKSSVADIDDTIFELIYLDDYSNLTVDLDYLYLEPLIFGGNVTSWSIVPDMFGEITFNKTNGVISGTPNMNFDLIVYEITASNSIYIDSYNVSIIAQYLDTDLDGVPDYIDEDDDGDGWADEDEVQCNTDPLEFYEKPGDIDSDNMCDSIDNVDDSPILFFYPNDKIVATVGEGISPIVPIVAPTGGDILNYNVTPDLPEGLEINNLTGIISGVPLKEFNHLILEYSHTITAVNSQYEFRYTVDFDILPEVIDDTDSDGDGWTDLMEIECGFSPLDSDSYPSDIDNDGKCALIDDDDDGDGRADLIDDFPNDPTAWLDTDGDGLPDEVTCQYAVNSAECALMDLLEDNDDDDDGWNDTAEIDCSTNTKNSTSIPVDDDNNGVCDRLEGFGVESVPKILWICCFPLVLLLLLLLWLANPFGVKDDEIRGPEPPYTSSSPKIEGGAGEYDDPFILKSVKGVRAGGSVESKELIKITNITPRLEIDFINLSTDDDDGRFNMNNMKANSRGEIEFRLQFNDFNMSSEHKKYVAFIRVGKASVYFRWEVEVIIPKEITEEEVRASKAAAKSAAIAAEAERIAAEANAKAERAFAEAEREAAIAVGISDAAKAAEEEDFDDNFDEDFDDDVPFEEEAAAKAAAEEEAAAKAAAEEEAAAKAAAEEEAAAKAAAEEEAAAKAAAMITRLRASQEEIERTAKEEAERALAEMNEKERAVAVKAAAAEEKKRKLLARVAEKAENIDFATIGIAATSEIVSEITTDSTSITLTDASAFPDSGNAYIYDPSGNILLEWEGKEENTLIGVSGITKIPPLGAIIIERDNLQDIKGVGPFIEEKLNALGIYTFKQIANMNLEIEEQVNVAIEFFPGRIRRDEWAKQAYDFINIDEN
jgi:alpha-tubulin suppressor-like RCC1 family protein